ncbi:MAG TPA: 50S ribosomal protein L24 [Crenotrichaceae bacterium]|nr:50S ribosomal protein L24 [Crenotrichaceae bacterium]
MSKLLKGDEVIVIAGRDKGKRGSVLKVLPNNRIIVDKINIVKKHQKSDPNNGVAGGIIEKEKSLHISNVAIYNHNSDKADRIGIRTEEDGSKIRFYKSDSQLISQN